MTSINSNQIVMDQNQSEAVREIPQVLTQRKGHPIRSEKYTNVPTIDTLQELEKAGVTWEIVAQERSTSKFAGYGTHLVRCTHPSLTLGNDALKGEIYPTFYIKNSHHGRTKFEMHIGLFRVFCMNGLILGNKFKTVKMKHIGLTAADILAQVEEMKEIFVGEVAPFVMALKEKKLTEAQQLEFAESALRYRVRKNENFIRGVNTEALLTSVRKEDEGAAIWEVLQRVQDNLGLNFRSSLVDVRYEYLAEDKDGNDIIKERKVSKLKNIQEVTDVNKYLFDLATTYLK